MLIVGLKVLDWSVGGFVNVFQSEEKYIDSTSTEYDTLFTSIDKGLDNLLLTRKLAKDTNEVKKLKSKIVISSPKTELQAKIDTVNKNPNFNFKKKETEFYLICSPGFIINKFGAVQYYLPGGDSRYYYLISLKNGTYQYQTISEPRDSVSFAVDELGAYKLGFQEIHPNFTIYKDSLK